MATFLVVTASMALLVGLVGLLAGHVRRTRGRRAPRQGLALDGRLDRSRDERLPVEGGERSVWRTAGR
jgi:hypothetical protein